MTDPELDTLIAEAQAYLDGRDLSDARTLALATRLQVLRSTRSRRQMLEIKRDRMAAGLGRVEQFHAVLEVIRQLVTDRLRDLPDVLVRKVAACKGDLPAIAAVLDAAAREVMLGIVQDCNERAGQPGKA
ncbi:MAG: hypothetical protein RBR52_14990 [Thiomonas sp.]|uniref:hypothetical protein n=1 Tax=Thiomonas sp. TaxID=2047785 RepID=UPI002A35BDF0|nr:hypothetical protein [Thiomonas sp.]MDY0331782.1 hypothetical protein [Thiomonas sp.]